jgi:PAS domain S-box-containing protein
LLLSYDHDIAPNYADLNARLRHVRLKDRKAHFPTSFHFKRLGFHFSQLVDGGYSGKAAFPPGSQIRTTFTGQLSMNISNEKFLRKLLGASINGIYIYDLKLGRNVYVNDQYTRITGYELEDINAMTGLQFFELFHPEDRPRVSEHFENISRGVETPEIEYRFKIKEGGWIWCLSRDQIFDRSEDGSVWQIIGSFFEISKLKRTEDALRKSEALYRAVVENFPEGAIYVFDQDLRFRVADGMAMESLGFTREGLEGKIIQEAVDKQTCSSLEKRYPRVLAGESLHYETELKGRVFSSDYVPIRDENGNVTAGMVVNKDITDRKRAEQALHSALAEAEESRRMLEALMAYAPVGITIANADGTIRLVSDFGERMTKRPRESLSQEPLGPHAKIWGIYLPDGQTLAGEEDLPLLRAVKYGEMTQNKELCFKTSEGNLIPILASAGPIHESGSGTAGGVIVWIDITARKKAEMQLKELNENLECQVAERTEIAEKRAYQLQQLALELSMAEDRQRQQIAQVLHDDLQQYLAALRFQLQVYLTGKADDKREQKLIQLVDESIQKCRSLSYELSPPVLHQNGLLAALNWLVSDMQERHGFYVEFISQPKAEPDSPELASMLFRSVRELLFNIVKHSGVNSAIVEVGIVDHRIRISVKDEGKGFDPVATEAKDGVISGFGLFTIKERVMFMGGRFDIESAPGKGCSVILEIPKKIQQKKFSEQFESGAINRQQTPVGQIQSSKVRILLADDHAVMRQGLSNILNEKEDFEIVGEAVNGREAVRLAKELNPDIILMDVSMPEMDGIEATMHISKVLSHTRIIGLSMHDDDETRDRMINAGASAYMYKASQAEELIEVIRGSLR